MGMIRPEALIFDVFGTVVDWRTGVAGEVERAFSGKTRSVDPGAFADVWRGQYQPSMTEIRSGRRGYVALDVLHRENLERTLAEFSLAGVLDESEKNALNHAWEKLPPWPDTVPGLTRLSRHFLIAACSNGSIALMSRLARHAGLPWHAILGAEIAGDYKPAPAVYLKSCAALALSPDRVMMVAAHNDDLHAAAGCGLKTAFVVRPQEHGKSQKTDLEPASRWDVTASDFKNLAEKLVP
jgi:2-haloacid dehalogenase